MSDKREYLKFISPRAVVAYPRLIKPDTGPKGKEGKPRYTVKGVFDPKDTKFTVGKATLSYDEVVEKLEEMRDAEYDRVLAEGRGKLKGKKLKDFEEKLEKKPVFGAALDEEGEETGEVYLFAKTGAQYKDKKTGKLVDKRPPMMFDSKGKKITGKLPAVGGGSTMKIAVSAAPYYVESSGAVGITFYLDSTQLIKLVEFGGGANPGFGSEGDDDGYDASDDADEDDGYGDESKGGKSADDSDDDDDDNF